MPLLLPHRPAFPAHGLGRPFSHKSNTFRAWSYGGPGSQVLGDGEIYSTRSHWRALSRAAQTRREGWVCHTCCIYGSSPGQLSGLEQGARLACRFGYSRHLRSFCLSCSKLFSWPGKLLYLLSGSLPDAGLRCWHIPRRLPALVPAEHPWSLHESLVGSSFSQFLI